MMNLQHNKIEEKDIIGISGMFRVVKFDKEGNEIVGKWCKNLVVSSNGYGRNIIARNIVGDTTYSMVVTQMTLSTNNTAPAVSDTALGGTEIDTPIQVPSVSTSGEAKVISFSAFFTDSELPNGTYYKVGLKMGSRLFTSAMLPSAETKDTGEQYRVDYQLTIN